MERKVPLAVGEYYHIYNRGADKRPIFLDENDQDRFIKLLYLCNSLKPISIREIPKGRSFEFERGETIVDIGAYCLMPNHFHLLIREKIDNGISLFMRKLGTAYSMYFNTKNGRSGILFQGRFKSSHADSDEYLRYLFAYIHLNPVKLIDRNWKEEGIKDLEKARVFLDKFKHSSYLDYIDSNSRTESMILNKSAFPEYFETKKDLHDYMNDWLYYQRTVL